MTEEKKKKIEDVLEALTDLFAEDLADNGIEFFIAIKNEDCMASTGTVDLKQLLVLLSAVQQMEEESYGEVTHH